VTRLLFVWVMLASALGYFKPGALLVLRPYLDWLFAFTMLGIGAVLTPRDFVPLARQPWLVLLGTAAQFGIMPALGFVVAKTLALPPDLALGVILAGAVPGAMASNVISYLAGADVAYSVAVTSTSTLLAPLLTPALTYAYGHAYIDVPFWPMFFSIIKTVIVPLAAGFAIRFLMRGRLDNFVQVFPAVSSAFIALICGLVVALNVGHLAQVTALVFLAVVLHNGFGLLLGYGAGMLYGFDVKRRRTLALEVGMQNVGLGVVLALKHLSPQTALPNAVFAIWALVTASLLAEHWGRHPGQVRPGEQDELASPPRV